MVYTRIFKLIRLGISIFMSCGLYWLFRFFWCRKRVKFWLQEIGMDSFFEQLFQIILVGKNNSYRL